MTEKEAVVQQLKTMGKWFSPFGAFLSAYSGNTVIIVSKSELVSKQRFAGALEELEEILDTVRKTEKIIKFSSGGAVRFMSITQGVSQFRGISAEVVFMD